MSVELSSTSEANVFVSQQSAMSAAKSQRSFRSGVSAATPQLVQEEEEAEEFVADDQPDEDEGALAAAAAASQLRRQYDSTTADSSNNKKENRIANYHSSGSGGSGNNSVSCGKLKKPNASSSVSNKPSIWTQLLASAVSRTSQVSPSQLVILGNADVGKSGLLSALQSYGSAQPLSPMEAYKSNDGLSAIDSGYINVRNIEDEDVEAADVLARCNVWILQSPEFKNLLVERLRAVPLKNLAVLICVSLQRAWSAVEELRRWLDLTVTIMEELLEELPVDDQTRLRSALQEYVNSYQTSVHRGMTTEQFITLGSHMTPLHAAAENPSGVPLSETDRKLGCNLGVPVIVAVCKSDSYVALDSRASQGQLNVIEAYLRNMCLPYGAALIYTSVKDPQQPKGVSLLYRYLFHRLYHFPFRETAAVACKDAVFVPSGWDARADVTEFASKTIAGGLEKPYETIVTRPIETAGYTDATDNNVPVEPMEDFLSRLLNSTPSLLSSPPQSPSTQESPYSPPTVALQPPAASSLLLTSAASTAASPSSLLLPQSRSAQQPAPVSATAQNAPVAPARRKSERVEPRASQRRPSTPEDPAGSTGDPASLQTFFQGLLAKGRQKGPPGTPRLPQSRSRPETPEDVAGAAGDEDRVAAVGSQNGGGAEKEAGRSKTNAGRTPSITVAKPTPVARTASGSHTRKGAPQTKTSETGKTTSKKPS